MQNIAVHKTFDEQGEPLYFVATTTGTVEASETKLKKLLSKLEPSETTLRITNASSAYSLIKGLEGKFTLVSAHWHATGIAKNLEPAEIAQKFYELPEELFTPIKVREDIFQLKQRIAARYSVVDFRRAAQLRLQAIARTLGLSKDSETWPSYLEAGRRQLAEEQKEIEGPIEKDINAAASKIPECIMLNEILGIKGKNSWMTSASVVAYLGDLERFPSVSALWAYSGQAVVNGRAPKRAKGQNSNWNPKLRTALWSWADSMLKTKNEKWRPVYVQYRDAEIAVHETKCERCAALKYGTEAQAEKKRLVIQSHSGARARRKVTKDVLKEFFIKVRGLDHKDCANTQRCTVEPPESLAVAMAD